jgi:imidazolonepropionase-like amidohydrolase
MALMQEAGLTPLEILRSATVHGAAAINMADDLGLVAPGRLADLLIVDADPLENLDNLSRIHRVVKNGDLFDPQVLMESVRSTQ